MSLRELGLLWRAPRLVATGPASFLKPTRLPMAIAMARCLVNILLAVTYRYLRHAGTHWEHRRPESVALATDRVVPTIDKGPWHFISRLGTWCDRCVLIAMLYLQVFPAHALSGGKQAPACTAG